MSESQTVLPSAPIRIGAAADHGGVELKEYLPAMLPVARNEVFDFGNGQPKPDDDYPDFVVPLAPAVAFGELHRGIATCGSPVRQEMERVGQFAGASNGCTCRTRVSAARPATDYTARLITSYTGVAVPLESFRILWQ